MGRGRADSDNPEQFPLDQVIRVGFELEQFPDSNWAVLRDDDTLARRCLKLMVRDGVKQVEVEFYGGGDDGTIDSVNPINYEDESVSSDDLESVVERLAHQILYQMVSANWTENDGGSGVLTIKGATPGDFEAAVDMSSNYYEMESETFPAVWLPAEAKALLDKFGLTEARCSFYGGDYAELDSADGQIEGDGSEGFVYDLEEAMRSIVEKHKGFNSEESYSFSISPSSIEVECSVQKAQEHTFTYSLSDLPQPL